MVPKHFRAVTLIKVAIMSYHPISQLSLIIQNNVVVLVPRYPQKLHITPGVIYPTLATTGLNAKTAFSHKIPEPQTIQTRKKVAQLIAQTGCFNRNVILIFGFKHLFPAASSKRNDSEIMQLSVAIGMARKQNHFFFGREVDVVWWSVAAKPYLKTYFHIQQ